MLSSFAHDTITVVRAPLVANEYGTAGAKRDWDNAVEFDVDFCNVQYQSTSELTDGRNAVPTRTMLRLPDSADILATDRVRWLDDVYEIDGQVQRWVSHSGALNHKAAPLVRVRG